MEQFEIKDLLTVKGKPGLWRLVTLIPGPKMARIKKLIDENQTATVKIKDVAAISEYKIYLIHGEMSLENVLDFIMGMEEKGLVTMEELISFDLLPIDKKAEMMNKLVPDYNPEHFKQYHLSKIIKWYKDVVDALNILNAGIEDPYKTN